MQIMLENGTVLKSDSIVESFLRWDGVPIPGTVEFQVILSDDIKPFLEIGKKITIGDDHFEFNIQKVSIFESPIIRDGQQVILGAYIAILEGLQSLIEPRSHAVILEDTSMGQIYRACGSRVKIGADVPALKFYCFVGDTPTFSIAKIMGEESVLVYYSKQKRIEFLRLQALMQQSPKHFIPPAAVAWIQNDTVLKHEIKTYQTVNSDGATIEGELKKQAVAAIKPNRDARRLQNLSTVLVVVGTVTRELYPGFMAGDIVQVGERKLVILTAVHAFKSGVLGDATVSASKIYLAELKKL